MFYAIGNVGDSKKTDDTRVNNKRDPKEHIVEISDADKPLSAFPTGKDGHAICPINEWKAGNTAYDILYSNEYVYETDGSFKSFGGKTYEFRYEMKDITEEQRQVNIDIWRDLYTFIVTSTDDEFYSNLKNYFVVDSALYYYLFTERYTMVDNRAKNSFWHYGKVYISNEEAEALGKTEASYYIIDDEAAAINDGYRYDLTFMYDCDTSLGIDNTGDYVFSYGKEDTDYYVDGDPSSDYVFRVADSVFFCRLRDLFPSELQAMFKDREEKNAWDSNSLIDQWDNSQAKFPEELWRLDYERKYYRTYLGLSIDNSISKGRDGTFLIGKFFGRKKYARRAFETNQEIYFATKYFGNKALSDVFWIRGNVPIGSEIKPNFSLTLTPYSDMYVCVQYTSTGTPIHKKVKAGETCVFENNSDRMDFIYVYAASFIQEVGDLSRCYVGDNNFAAATRLQKLVIGSTDAGYENTFMKKVEVANNPLLEYLDIRNISGIDTVIDVGGCGNLKELYAEGTNATGAIFANGGLLHVAHLPSVKSLSMRNLSHVEDLSIETYDALERLIIENCPGIDTYNIVTNSPNLRFVRLINLYWNADDSSIFNRLLSVGGVDSSGITDTDQSVLTGNATVPIIGQYELYSYQEAWPELIIVPKDGVIPQYKVTFRNYDGTELDVQYVNQYGNAVDPTIREDSPIDVPKKESSVQYNYLYTGWDKSFTNIVMDMDIYATYENVLRDYTIQYVSMGVPVKTATGKYGDYISDDGIIPTYTAAEPTVFYLFNRWDKSGFLTGDFDENGVKTVNAIFDTFDKGVTYFNGVELADLSPVELYALIKLSASGKMNIGSNEGQTDASYDGFITDGDTYSIALGHDFIYDDIDSVEIIGENSTFGEQYRGTVEFTGQNYFDTGIQLFDEDKDFVLAIDYEFNEAKQDSVIAQCYQGNGSVGFKLQYNNGVDLVWSSDLSDNIARVNSREMLILRHKKGDSKLYVYSSNLRYEDIAYNELTSKNFTSSSTLIFGCNKQTSTIFNNYAKGKIHWAKVWYADLGDDACKTLASWTHETVDFNACGFNRYFLADSTDEMCSFSLLASNLLSNKKKWNNETSNTGGWASSSLNEFLNSRLYEAFPAQIRGLLKKVSVKSSIGDESIEVSSSACYIAIPAIIDVSSSERSAPYHDEGTPISFMTSTESRKRAYKNGAYDSYWLRSPSIVTTSAADYYVWSVSQSGATSKVTAPTTECGILIEISF